MTSQTARERIIAATRQVLAERTPETAADVSIGEVALAAQVSRTTVYHHFNGKDDLLRAAGVQPEALEGDSDPRTRIYEAALEVFAERGIHGATFPEIARRAGMTVSGLHWHVRNKEELVAGVTRYIPVIQAVAAETALGDTRHHSLEEQLLHIAEAMLQTLSRYRGALRMMICETQMYPDVAELARSYAIGRVLPMLTGLFDQHARAGVLAPGSARARAQAFLGMLLPLVLLRPTFDDLLDPDDHASVREYVRIMLHGIQVSPGGISHDTSSSR